MLYLINTLIGLSLMSKYLGGKGAYFRIQNENGGIIKQLIQMQSYKKT